MTCLSIIQDTCLSLGFGSPSAAVGQTAYLQMVALLNLEGKDLAKRAPWKVLRRKTTFTLSTSSSNQGAMNSTVVTAGDFDYLLPESFFNTTRSLIVDGPISAEDEETIVATGSTGPYQQFTIKGGSLYIYPQPGSADTIGFQYMSNFWCQSSGGTKKAAFTVDTDTGILDEGLLTLGLIWRWKRANGLDYTQEFDTYERQVHDYIAREASGARTLSMEGRGERSFGVVVPLWV